MNIMCIIDTLREKRKVFYSEADFQFSLSWEIQLHYPDASVRLEYPAPHDPTKHIDIFVRLGNAAHPIELKYSSKLLNTQLNGETYSLKEQGAQDIGKYDFVKDICRIEDFRDHIAGYQEGYTIWLTNDPHYWTPPKNDNVGHLAFSIHDGAVKQGTMSWGASVGDGTSRGRQKPLTLSSRYLINWQEYSHLNISNGVFMYSVVQVKKEG